MRQAVQETVTVELAKVRQKRQTVHEATGEGDPIPRTVKQLRSFLEGRIGPADPGHHLAAHLLKYLAGGKSENEMNEAWEQAFDTPISQRKIG